jgi:hypothetical protein
MNGFDASVFEGIEAARMFPGTVVAGGGVHFVQMFFHGSGCSSGESSIPGRAFAHAVDQKMLLPFGAEMPRGEGGGSETICVPLTLTLPAFTDGACCSDSKSTSAT